MRHDAATPCCHYFRDYFLITPLIRRYAAADATPLIRAITLTSPLPL